MFSLYLSISPVYLGRTSPGLSSRHSRKIISWGQVDFSDIHKECGISFPTLGVANLVKAKSANAHF